MNRGIARVVVSIGVVIALAPLLWLCATALKTRAQVTAVPPEIVFRPTLSNFHISYYGNDVAAALLKAGVIAAVSASLVTLLGAGTAAWLRSTPLVCQRRVLWLLLSSRMGPVAVSLIPLFVLSSWLGMGLGTAFIVILHMAASLPLAIWYVARGMERVPSNIRLAALVDGASLWQADLVGIWRPLLPVLALTWLLAFVLSWNEYPIASLFSSSATRPINAMLPVFMNLVVQWGEFAAVALVALLPGLFVSAVVGLAWRDDQPQWWAR